MKVLWVTNLVVPEGASLADPASATFGGWVANMLAALAGTEGLQLAVLIRTPSGLLRFEERDGVCHTFVPTEEGRRTRFDAAALRQAFARLEPDILHIEGAEMAHAADVAEIFEGPVVVSVQGVVRGLMPHEFGGLPVHRWSFGWHRPARALTAAALIAAKELKFRPRLAAEARTMARADHVIGRTEWDHAYAALLAPRASYTSVPRILRPAFYAPHGPRQEVVRHRLFIGNAHHPRKGAHIVLAALKLLRRRFPDVSLVIAGEPPVGQRGDWKRRLGYPAELARQIDAAGLGDCVHYTGVLDAPQMVREMRRAHVFVLSSLIENSPNTLAEAMMLGLPIVSAYAGGAPDMAQPDAEALFYRPSDPACLAHQVGRLFQNDALAARLGAAAAARAAATHDRAASRDRLLALYRAVFAGVASPTTNVMEAA